MFGQDNKGYACPPKPTPALIESSTASPTHPAPCPASSPCPSPGTCSRPSLEFPGPLLVGPTQRRPRPATDNPNNRTLLFPILRAGLSLVESALPLPRFSLALFWQVPSQARPLKALDCVFHCFPVRILGPARHVFVLFPSHPTRNRRSC